MKKIYHWMPFAYCLMNAFYPLCRITAELIGYDFILNSISGYSIVLSLLSLLITVITISINHKVSRFEKICACLCCPLGMLNTLSVLLLNEPSYLLIVAFIFNISSAWNMYIHSKGLRTARFVTGIVSGLLTLIVMICAMFSFLNGNFSVSKVMQSIPSPDGKCEVKIVSVDQKEVRHAMVRLEFNSFTLLHIGSFCTSSQVIYYDDWENGASLEIHWIDNHTLQIGNRAYIISEERAPLIQFGTMAFE